MGNFDLSIVVLVYNQPDLLEYQLWQLKNQDYITPKLIVVDDASSSVEAGIQQSTSEYYGAKYMYDPCVPKRFRKARCGLLGIEQADTEFVGIFDVHHHLDKDYLFKCSNIISKYKNVVLTHHWWWLLEYLDEVKDNHITLGHLDGTKHEPLCNCIDWTYYCKQLDIRPTKLGMYADGNFWFRTDVARKCYDPNVYGYGNISSDIAMSAVYYGQSNVVVGDIHAYHIRHEKTSFMTREENSLVREYMESKYKSWGTLPDDNGLILI